MSYNATVTPGATVSPSTVIDDAVLNALGTPTVTIPDDGLPASAIDPVTLASRFGSTFRGQNYLPWGVMMEEQMAAASVTCAAGAKTYPLPAWWVTPTGAAAAATFSQKTSSNTTTDEYRAALKVTASASGMTLLELGTKLPPGLCQILATGSVTFSLYIRNRTGTSFTPVLRIRTPNSPGDDSSMTLRSSVTGTACADSVWTRVSFTFDATSGSITNWDDGAYLIVEITCGSGVMGSGEYILFADAQIDAAAAATSLIAVPPAASPFPAGVMLPYGGSVAPAGWLLCDGTGYSTAKYPALYGAIGYGYGGSAGTFNVPDMRGRSFAGAEVSGASQSRLQVSVAITSSATDTLTVAAGAADALRPGMGVYGHANIAAGTYVTEITNTTIKLSTSTLGSVAGQTLRFGKLGASADPETVGSAGPGVTGGRRRISLIKAGASVTSGSNVLTLPNITDVACGMTVSMTNVPAGTTIAAFISATTVRMSANATASGTATATLGVDAPEDDQMMLYEYLLKNVNIDGCGWDADVSAPYKLDTVPLATTLVQKGDLVTGDTVPADSYVTAVPAATEVEVSASLAAASSSASVTLTFSRASLSRATANAALAGGVAVGSYIIKY